jgi:hypothetical protein
MTDEKHFIFSVKVVNMLKGWNIMPLKKFESQFIWGK